jgi:predicted Zn-dependent protease
VLEPQATADLVAPLVESAMDRGSAEGVPGAGPFTRHDGTSKIGQKLFDARVTISADPMDPDLGFPPFAPWSFTEVYHPVTWIDKGVLKELSYGRQYGVQHLARKSGLPNSTAFRLAGGTTSLEEMIATTPRGLLITRFSGVQLMDSASMMVTGYTRDGVWLIEHGRMGRAVKNMRFMESPVFALNKLEALGPAQRVFRQGSPAVAPLMKVRDFNFTSLVDVI